MPAYIYPSASELQLIEQEKIAQLTMDDPLFNIMPIVTSDSHLLEWEQEDNFVGLQNVRGLNGQPGMVKNIGGKRFRMEPGVYGDVAMIDEEELTKRRQYGTYNQPVNITDLVVRRQDQLLQRRIDRIKQIGWTLLASGTFSVSRADGTVLHTDTYSPQPYSAIVAWATSATARPLADFRAIKLLGRGKGVSFGTQAKAYMNQTTFNTMIGNTNANDLFGLRTNGLSTVLGLAQINQLLLQDGSATIVIHDEGYLNDAGTFVPFIADNKVVVVGQRTSGAAIADYAMTRNATNEDLGPGAYTYVHEDKEPPRAIRVHDGHNGGPRLYFPSALIIMTV